MQKKQYFVENERSYDMQEIMKDNINEATL
jgi:hypothetical protein